MSTPFERQVLEALEPPASRLRDDLVSWKPFDTSQFIHYLRFIGDHACKVNAKLPHDAGIVVAFLAELTPTDLQKVDAARPLHLTRSEVLAATPFQARAIVHPSIVSGSLTNDTEFMDGRVYDTCPVYLCEFPADDTVDEVKYRRTKVVRWSDWSREPAPALSARYLQRRSGGKSSGGKRMGIFRLDEVAETLASLAVEDGFIEIENFERRLVRIEHAKGRYSAQQDGQTWVLPSSDAIDWLRVFAIEGAGAALAWRERHGA